MHYWSLIMGIVLITFLVPALSLAPWVPMNRRDLKRINKLAALQPGQTFFEFGCGDGRVCFYLAKNNPQAKIIGMEYAPIMYLIAKFRSWFNRYTNLVIRYGDAMAYPLNNIDVLYVYGIPSSMNTKMKQKILDELKPDSKAISYYFSIDAWAGQSSVDYDLDFPRRAPIYIYQKKSS